MKTASAVIAALMFTACAIPGIGPHASEVVERFIGLRFTNPAEPKVNPDNRQFYSSVGKGETRLYRTETEGSGKRYYATTSVSTTNAASTRFTSTKTT